MYTKNGEVVNRGLAQAYADEFGIYFYKNTSTLTNPNLQTFMLVDDDSLVNTGTNAIEAKRTSIDTYDKFSSKFTTIINDTLFLPMVRYVMISSKDYVLSFLCRYL